MTGVPQACASSGTMPKSSSAANTNARAPRISARSRSRGNFARELDVRTGGRADARGVRTVTGDDQPARRAARERGGDGIDALVGNPARRGQVISAGAGRLRPGREIVDVDRRIDDVGLPAIAARMRSTMMPGNAGEAIDAVALARSHSRSRSSMTIDQRALDAAADSGEIGVSHVPSVAHRRQAVAEVQRALAACARPWRRHARSRSRDRSPTSRAIRSRAETGASSSGTAGAPRVSVAGSLRRRAARRSARAPRRAGNRPVQRASRPDKVPGPRPARSRRPARCRASHGRRRCDGAEGQGRSSSAPVIAGRKSR